MTVTARTELELREKLAARTAREADEQARAICAVGSKFCRADEPEDWLELEHRGRTYNFCGAHALAAEVLAAGGLMYAELEPLQIVARISGLEQQRGHRCG